MTCVCIGEYVNIVTIVIFCPCRSCPHELMFVFGFAMRVYNRGSLSHVWFTIKESNIFTIMSKINEANMQSTYYLF